MKRWKCLCAYDGTDFAGWQSQPTGDAVQDHLEAALAAVFKSPVRIHGSGRTDAGVHALGQVFHFDASWNHGRGKLLSALGSHLPSSIQMKSVRPVSGRFPCPLLGQGEALPLPPVSRPGRSLRDRLRPIHPFSLGCGCDGTGRPLPHWQIRFFRLSAVGRGSCRRKTRSRNSWPFRIRKRGKRIRMTFEASGFLYKMARSLTGALLRVGQGKLSPEDFEHILLNRVRTADVVTAPAPRVVSGKGVLLAWNFALNPHFPKMRRER